MAVEFRELSSEDKKRYRETILEMMRESDKDFVPPLSARTSTRQKNLTNVESTENGIELYYEEMNQQGILGAFEGKELLVFVSFRKDYCNDIVGKDTLPNIYMSTLVMKSSARGKGLTTKLYDHLFRVCYPECSVYTRTWSTNGAHSRILEKFGFVEIARLKNDRGAGIDTVYFERKRQSEEDSLGSGSI